MLKTLFRFVLLLSFLLCGDWGEAKDVLLLNKFGSVVCDASSLQLKIRKADGPFILLSAAQTDLGLVKELESSATNSTWEYPGRGVRVNMRLEGDQLSVHISSDRTGNFTFPIMSQTASMRGWILPLFEGVYVPVDDVGWKTFLTDRGEMNTTADLTMPFLGLHLEDSTVTCIVTNPFNNRLTFHSNATGLEARLTHEFTRNHSVKEYGLVFRVGKDSPVEPAKHYRDWLKERGEFVSLREKIKRTPEAVKLLGAAHVYVWGEDLIAATDVLDWKLFALELQNSAKAEESSPAHRVWSLMETIARDSVTNILRAEWPDKYLKSLVISDLNRILLQADFYHPESWRNVSIGKEASALLKKDRSALTKAELSKLNCDLLFAAFSRLLVPPERWGSGVSSRMMKEFSEAGLDRLWVGASSWEGFVRRPETVATAKSLGFLIGPYDSYHSMHSPDEEDSWETAQFGAEAYKTGAIVNADGTRRHGFKKKGFLFSPVAARPFVENRVTGLMDQFAANSWFIDCDGFGEFFDDYSEAHPATQLADMRARLSRMAWIRDRFGAVIGTEGCFAGVASTVHFAHGVMTPVIGWGDPDLKDKQSKYYLGAYYPSDEPAVFFKPTPIKEEYRHIFYDPRFRLPLFQIVFHDSVIATHHWSNPSLKFPAAVRDTQMLELLYNVPPLYHLNPGEFGKSKAEIKRHYDIFSPLHRELALLPMTSFEWLNEARTVQRTVFGGKVEIIANFTDEEFRGEKAVVMPCSIAVGWLHESKRLDYNVLKK